MFILNHISLCTFNVTTWQDYNTNITNWHHSTTSCCNTTWVHLFTPVQTNYTSNTQILLRFFSSAVQISKCHHYIVKVSGQILDSASRHHQVWLCKVWKGDKLLAVVWPLSPPWAPSMRLQLQDVWGGGQWEAAERLWLAALRLYCGFWLSCWAPGSSLTSTAAVIQNHNKPRSPGAITAGRLRCLIVEVKQRKERRPQRAASPPNRQEAVRSAVTGSAARDRSPQRSAQTKLCIL